MSSKTVRIGCGAAFWGDSPYGPGQLVNSGEIDYLVMDYLAEITMSILARMKARDANAGYASDFVDAVMAPLLESIASNHIRVVTNAGGINPQACCDALRSLIQQQGLSLTVAAVTGDDLSDQFARFQQADIREMSTGEPLPERISSINAYLGAGPIATALNNGADIVITGRGVDSALVLGPLIHEFSWARDDYDLLASGSLAGHIIECGNQCTGGLYTDWQDVPGWENMGYPIAECRADGTFSIRKPPNTGGLITPATVAEQIVYEIGDPSAYLLPDVVADFSHIAVVQSGPNEISVSGAKGRAPSTDYKTSITYPDGYRLTATMMIGGIDAAKKANRVADAVVNRARRLFDSEGYADFNQVSIEVLGDEATYGPHRRPSAVREVVLKIAVSHAQRDALVLLSREIYPTATSMAPGITGFAGGRPTAQPVIRLFSCLIPKSWLTPTVTIDDNPLPDGAWPSASAAASAATAIVSDSTTDPVPSRTPAVDWAQQPLTRLPLIKLAHARSGDKGDSTNIGVLARDPRLVPLLEHQLTAQAVGDWFAHLIDGPVVRYPWPGLAGFNFVLERSLGGGGVASLRYDPQGKAYAQMLLDLPIDVPSEWCVKGGILGDLAGTGVPDAQ